MLQGTRVRTYYINSIHPMETHDLASMDDRIGRVGGERALDEDFNKHVLPPINPRK